MREFDLELKYRPGERMAHVDALSRSATTNVNKTNSEIEERHEILKIMSEEDYILLIQQSDAKLKTY